MVRLLDSDSGLSSFPSYDNQALPKYQLIMEKLHESFDAVNTASKFTHISGFEIMMNRALHACIQEDIGNSDVVVAFLEDALVKKNPLSIYGPMQLFPEDENPFADTESPMYSVTHEYDEMIERTVSALLNQISNKFITDGKISEAGMIDLLVLIGQYALSILGSLRCNSDNFLQMLFCVIIEFPDPSFNAFSRFIQNRKSLESTEMLFTEICNYLRESIPLEFAGFQKTLNSIIIENYRSTCIHQLICDIELSSIDSYFFDRLNFPANIDEHRLCMLVLSSLSFRDPDFISENFPPDFCYFFCYGLLKRASELFPGIDLGSSEIHPESELLDLQELMKEIMISPASAIKISDYLERFVIFGMPEAIKFVTDINVANSYSCQLDLIFTSICLSQWRITDYLLENINFPSLTDQVFEQLCHQAVRCPSPRALEKLFNYLSPSSDLNLTSITADSINHRMFVNFDFLWERFKDFPNFSLHTESKFLLVMYALESRLSDEKVREYIEIFGSLATISEDKTYEKLFIRTAVDNGYLNLIKYFSFEKLEKVGL